MKNVKLLLFSIFLSLQTFAQVIIDSTFGENGTLTIPASEDLTSRLFIDMAVKSNGEIMLIASEDVMFSDNTEDLISVKNDGSDYTYLAHCPEETEYNLVNRLAVQSTDDVLFSSGYIFLSGVYPGVPAIGRYTDMNECDLTFQNNGFLVTEAEPFFIKVTEGDKFFTLTPGGDLKIEKYLSNGTPDSSFGGDGKPEIDFDPGFPSIKYMDMLLNTTGEIFIISINPASQEDFLVIKITPEGELDTSFGDEGYLYIDFTDSGSNRKDNNRKLALAADGKILVAGSSRIIGINSSADLAIAKFDADGNLDNTFGGDGSED